MSASDDNGWFDPRLTVFIIWGIFVILFVCIPSKRLVQKIFTVLGCKCCAYEEEIAPSNDDGHEMMYEILTNARKQEIDSLRASHLTYRMHPFTMTLEKKYMLRRISDEDQKSNNVTPLPQDRKEQDGDIESGFVRGVDPPEGDEGEENKEEEDAPFTHVLIPEPGHNFDGIDVLELAKINGEKEKKADKDEKKPKMRLFGGKGNKEENTKDVKEEPDSAKEVERKGERRRSCTIFCAICLAEYEQSQRISWSSNPDCTHVFHEDCVVEWLVSLGRTKSKMQRFSEDPTEVQLLNYQLECPCCRQDFIDRRRCDLPELPGDENV